MTVATDKELSVRMFAKSLEVSPGVIQNIAYKKVEKVNPIHINALCHTHDVNKEWLLYGIGEKYRKLTPDEEIAKLFAKVLNHGNEAQKKIFTEIQKIENLTDGELQSIIDYINFIKSKKTPKN